MTILDKICDLSPSFHGASDINCCRFTVAGDDIRLLVNLTMHHVNHFENILKLHK